MEDPRDPTTKGSNPTPPPAGAPPEENPEEPKDAADKTEKELRDEFEVLQQKAQAKRYEFLESISPDLPTKVAGWKQKYPHIESIHIGDVLYIYRGIRRDEYLGIMRQGQDRFKNDELIAAKCKLWPEGEMDWIRMDAGLPGTLSDLVMAASGFQPTDPAPVRL